MHQRTRDAVRDSATKVAAAAAAAARTAASQQELLWTLAWGQQVIGFLSVFMRQVAKIWYNDKGVGPVGRLWRSEHNPAQSVLPARRVPIFLMLGVIISAVGVWMTNDAYVQGPSPPTDAAELPVHIAFQNVGCMIKGMKRPALQNVTGEIAPGRLTAVLGQSGSGKSTLTHALLGRGKKQCSPASGVVYLNGEQSPLEVYLDRVGFVPQDDVLYPELTVEETLRFSADWRLPRGISDERKEALLQDTLDTLDLNRIRHQRVGDVMWRGISGGEKKRVSIGMELIAAPSVLVMDEPTSGLDSAGAYRLVRTLRMIADKGVSVVTVLHQPSARVFDLIQDLVLLQDGRAVYVGDKDGVLPYLSKLGYAVPGSESSSSSSSSGRRRRSARDSSSNETEQVPKSGKQCDDEICADGQEEGRDMKRTSQVSGDDDDVGEVEEGGDDDDCDDEYKFQEDEGEEEYSEYDDDDDDDEDPFRGYDASQASPAEYLLEVLARLEQPVRKRSTTASEQASWTKGTDQTQQQEQQGGGGEPIDLGAEWEQAVEARMLWETIQAKMETLRYGSDIRHEAKDASISDGDRGNNPSGDERDGDINNAVNAHDHTSSPRATLARWLDRCATQFPNQGQRYSFCLMLHSMLAPESSMQPKRAKPGLQRQVWLWFQVLSKLTFRRGVLMEACAVCGLALVVSFVRSYNMHWNRRPLANFFVSIAVSLLGMLGAVFNDDIGPVRRAATSGVLLGGHEVAQLSHLLIKGHVSSEIFGLAFFAFLYLRTGTFCVSPFSFSKYFEWVHLIHLNYMCASVLGSIICVLVNHDPPTAYVLAIATLIAVHVFAFFTPLRSQIDKDSLVFGQFDSAPLVNFLCASSYVRYWMEAMVLWEPEGEDRVGRNYALRHFG
jgi:ABC-type multidrug transport system ATPase subunit